MLILAHTAVLHANPEVMMVLLLIHNALMLLPHSALLLLTLQFLYHLIVCAAMAGPCHDGMLPERPTSS
jgi:hypothetical protein